MASKRLIELLTKGLARELQVTIQYVATCVRHMY